MRAVASDAFSTIEADAAAVTARVGVVGGQGVRIVVNSVPTVHLNLGDLAETFKNSLE